MNISKRVYGQTYDGREVYVFTMVNSKGMSTEITNYGAIVISLFVPDKNGKLEDIVLGYDNFEKYLENPLYFGAIIGRYANRIENAEFQLNGKEYKLLKNNGRNHIHGGLNGFDKVVWNPEITCVGEKGQLRLSYLSPDGEEGYPGNLNVSVTYTLTEDNALEIDYYGISDKDTVINLTNHCYFNLSGNNAGEISGHRIMICADKFTVINEECMPTGEIRDVAGTPLDFRESAPIGPGISSSYEQIAFGNGYDHNYVLNVSGKKPEKAAKLFDPTSGRVMEVFTTKPGLQFYSGNNIDGSMSGKGGVIYGPRSGLCLETQYFPNSLKHRHFPSPVFKAGQEYRHTTCYRFSNI